MEPSPPIRAPNFFWDEDGPATRSSAEFLLGLLCDFAGLSPIWKDRAGREIAVSVERETKQDALITLSGAFEGRIELSVAPSLWVRADVCLGDTWVRAGLDRALL
jgi:hypothetical protein